MIKLKMLLMTSASSFVNTCIGLVETVKLPVFIASNRACGGRQFCLYFIFTAFAFLRS